MTWCALGPSPRQVAGKGHVTLKTLAVLEHCQCCLLLPGAPQHKQVPLPNPSPSEQAPPALSLQKSSWAQLWGPNRRPPEGSFLNTAEQPCFVRGLSASPAPPGKGPLGPSPKASAPSSHKAKAQGLLTTVQWLGRGCVWGVQWARFRRLHVQPAPGLPWGH